MVATLAPELRTQVAAVICKRDLDPSGRANQPGPCFFCWLAIRLPGFRTRYP